MKTLNKDWITEKHIDFEYKKYLLLAYLHEVSNCFEVNKLYPSLADLINHYKYLRAIKENKQNLWNAFPQRIKKLDPEQFRIQYEKLINDDKIMQEIENIIDYSMPQFEHYLQEGKKIYDFIEEQLYIQPVGIVPLNPAYGYLFLKDGKNADTNVYEYRITLFEEPGVKYRGIHTQYITTYRRSYTNTYESIKTDMLRAYKNIPNPATYAAEIELSIPLEEAFLPIAKRSLVKYIGEKV